MLDNPVAGPPRAISVSGGGWVRLHVSSASVGAIGQVSSPVLAGPENARQRRTALLSSLNYEPRPAILLEQNQFQGTLGEIFCCHREIRCCSSASFRDYGSGARTRCDIACCACETRLGLHAVENTIPPNVLVDKRCGRVNKSDDN
jgi:hypothetical protein